VRRQETQPSVAEEVKTAEQEAISARVVKTAGLLVPGGTPGQQKIAEIATRLAQEVPTLVGTVITVEMVQLISAATRRAKGKVQAEGLRSRVAVEEKQRRKIEATRERLQKQQASLEQKLAKLQAQA